MKYGKEILLSLGTMICSGQLLGAQLSITPKQNCVGVLSSNQNPIRYATIEVYKLSNGAHSPVVTDPFSSFSRPSETETSSFQLIGIYDPSSIATAIFQIADASFPRNPLYA